MLKASLKSFFVYYLGFVLLIGASLVLPQIGLTYGVEQSQLLSLRTLPYFLSLYFVACVFFVVNSFSKKDWILNIGHLLIFIASAATAALLITATFEAYKVLEEGYVAITNLFEVSLLFSFSLSLLSLIYDFKSKSRYLTAAVSPLLCVAACWALYLDSIGQGGPRELVPALKSYWLTYHVFANFIGYGAFGFAAVLGLMILWVQKKERQGKPTEFTTQQLELLSYRVIAVGFPIFSVAIILGSLWAYEAWGGYWSWDPKETWALIVWLVYAAYLHARMQRKYSLTLMSLWLILGFLVTVFCFLGVNLFLSGLHSYGTLA